METFSALLALCERNPPVTIEFPSQRPVMQSFDVFFDLRLRTNGWANNWDVSDLRCHQSHYDITVIIATSPKNRHVKTNCCKHELDIAAQDFRYHYVSVLYFTWLKVNNEFENYTFKILDISQGPMS